MLFHTAAAITLISSLLGIQIQAAPLDEPALTLLKTEDFGDYQISFYADATSPRNSAPAPHPPAAQACGSNDLACSDDHQADREVCSKLVSHLKSQENDSAPANLRGICSKISGRQCCVSWSADVAGLHFGHLLNSISKIMDSCNYRGDTVSGLTLNTDLAGTCVMQCLSNRAEGCS